MDGPGGLGACEWNVREVRMYPSACMMVLAELLVPAAADNAANRMNCCH